MLNKCVKFYVNIQQKNSQGLLFAALCIKHIKSKTDCDAGDLHDAVALPGTMYN